MYYSFFQIISRLFSIKANSKQLGNHNKRKYLTTIFAICFSLLLIPTSVYANHDTDNDGVTDETENLEGTNPNDPNDTPVDRAITPAFVNTSSERFHNWNLRMINSAGYTAGEFASYGTVNSTVNGDGIWLTGADAGGLPAATGSPPPIAGQEIVFSYVGTRTLSGAYVWNASQIGNLYRGVQNFDVLVSTDSNFISGTYTLVGNYTLTQGGGTAAEASQYIDFGRSYPGVAHVKFRLISNFNTGANDDYIGLNEVRLELADHDGDWTFDDNDPDDDNDGVIDLADACPVGTIGTGSGPANSDYDGDGCNDTTEDDDDDGDGVLDGADSCPTGHVSWVSNPTSDNDGDGCRDSTEDTDDDNDGVSDTTETSEGTDPLDNTDTPVDKTLTPTAVHATSSWVVDMDNDLINGTELSVQTAGSFQRYATVPVTTNGTGSWIPGPNAGALGGPTGTPPAANTQELVFDLGSLKNLSGAYVWNMNQDPCCLYRGVQNFDILVSSDANYATATYRSIGSFTLSRANGADEPSQYVNFGSTIPNIRLIKFDLVSNYDTGDPLHDAFIGLQEVRFEAADTDGDRILDDVDTDDDNDGIPDGTDTCPRDADVNNVNTDGDELCNVNDIDDDNDGIADNVDVYPLIPIDGRPDADSDGASDTCDAACQATGMSEDLDDDNDGVSDVTEGLEGTDPLDNSSTPADLSIIPTSAVSSSHYGGNTSAANLINSSGLSTSEFVRYATHDNALYSTTMWLSGLNDGGLGGPYLPQVNGQAVIFDLGANYSISSALIWNNNDQFDVNQGVKDFEILVSSDTDPLTATFTSVGNHTLAKAGNTTTEPSQLVNFALSNNVRLVKFVVATSFGSDWVGLSEVRLMQSDTDGDYIPNATDTDDDGDGVLDAADNCPVNANAGQEDLDSDNIGDVCDTDIDGDGFSNSDETDNGTDPRDATSTPPDLDGDKVSDLNHPDIDGDGFSNSDETDNGTSPTDATSSPPDNDGDFISDLNDTDDDNDGVADTTEVLEGTDPLDNTDTPINLVVTPTSAVASNDAGGAWSPDFIVDDSGLETAKPGEFAYQRRHSSNINRTMWQTQNVAGPHTLTFEMPDTGVTGYDIDSGYFWQLNDSERGINEFTLEYSTTDDPTTYITVGNYSLASITGALIAPENIQFPVMSNVRNIRLTTISSHNYAGQNLNIYGLSEAKFRAADTDGDRIPNHTDTDDDNDTVLDTTDNCPYVANTPQTNTDGDSQGDACDADDDNDGVLDASDSCPLSTIVWTSDATNDNDSDGCRDSDEDLDDDNDGVSDLDETALGTDPLDNTSTPVDLALAPFGVYDSSRTSPQFPVRTISGGLTINTFASLATHNNTAADMWISGNDAGSLGGTTGSPPAGNTQELIIFLGDSVTADVDGLYLWNYNETGQTGRGINQFEILTSTDTITGSSIASQLLAANYTSRGTFTLAEAGGTATQNAQLISLPATLAGETAIRLKVISDHGGDGYVGLSELRVQKADTDGDWIPNDTDTDDDNDGVPDASDACPLVGFITDANGDGCEDDAIAPVISLTGANPQELAQGSAYVELGATASDNLDGDISGSIVIDASAVNTAAVGSYSLTYNVSDGAGNAATEMTRTVNVTDQTAPVISLTGANPLSVALGSTYSDPGATASDNNDGDISVNIVTDASAIDTSTVGSYSVTYNVSDAAGNAATEVTRTVNVSDQTAPVISLIGQASVTIAQGGSYTEQGATATDNLDGDLSANIVIGGDTVDTTTVGTYVIRYNVSDVAGNAANEVTRTVTVADQTIPVITLTGSASLTIAQGSVYGDAGATASDNNDGDLTSSIVTTGSVDTSTVGTYQIKYNVSDAAGNAAVEITRTVDVTDQTIPLISLTGQASVTVAQGGSYSDAGATASDNNDGDISVNIVVSGDTVDTTRVGIYTIIYNVSDAAGNAAVSASRTVSVTDQTIPVISLTGQASVTVAQGGSYSDAGATASDNNDGDISVNIVVSGDTVDTTTVGTYVIRYNVSDAAGNAAAEVTRTVTVADQTAPVISLTGQAAMTVAHGSTFTDPGATASDNNDGDITADIFVGGTVDTNTVGAYLLIYDVFDAAGNAAATVVRTVTVTDQTAPVISLTGANPLNIPQGETYNDPGATALDNVDGDLTSSITVGGDTVDTTTLGTYVVSYSVSDAAGNPSEVARTVNVVDTTAPVVLAPTSITVAATDATGTAASHADIDLFLSSATATDDTDGTISPVLNDAPAQFPIGVTVVTFSATDAAGNSGQAQATVTVEDQTAPLISLIGQASVTVALGGSYTDAGATASDNVDGDVTASIAVSGDTVDVNILGTYVIRYNVSDAATNAALEVTRSVTVQDAAAPVVSAPSAIVVAAVDASGTPATDAAIVAFLAGASANDDVDGALAVSHDGSATYP